MTAQPDFLLVNEVAVMLRRDEATIRRMIRRGELEAFKPGGNVYLIPREAVEALLERSRVEPDPPPPARHRVAVDARSVPAPRPSQTTRPRRSFRERAKEASAARRGAQ